MRKETFILHDEYCLDLDIIIKEAKASAYRRYEDEGFEILSIKTKPSTNRPDVGMEYEVTIILKEEV